MEEFAHNYMGRIHALTATYSLLSSEGWQTVLLETLLLEELKPFVDTERKNVVLRGPSVALEPRAALALGMAIHELTTNAVKYGALSVPQRSVTVAWRVETGGEDDQLELDWTESDGLPVTPPDHRGFGMVLIERGLKQDMSAQVEVEFARNGVRARLRAPIRRAPPRKAAGKAGT